MKLKKHLWLAMTVASLHAHAGDTSKASYFSGPSAVLSSSYTSQKSMQSTAVASPPFSTANDATVDWRDKTIWDGLSSENLAMSLSAISRDGAHLGSGFYFKGKALTYKLKF